MFESKLDKIAGLLRKKLTPLTKLQLQTSGRITKFPKFLRQRYVLPTNNDYEQGIMPGTYVRRVAYKGSFSVTTDLLPTLNDNTVTEFQGQVFNVVSNDKDILYFNRTIEDVSVDTQIFFKSYTIQSDGEYEEGIQQLLIRSPLPVIPGDQWYVRTPIGSNSIATVIKAHKTPNSNQWDVILKAPIIFYIPKLEVKDIIIARDATGYFNPNRPVYYLATKADGTYQCSFRPDFLVPITIHPYQVQTVYRDNVAIFERDPSTHIVLTNNAFISVQVSSSVYWESIPVEGPAILSLPVATHLKDSKAIVVNCIQYASFSEVIHSVFSNDRRFKISSGQIFAHSWLNAQRIEGFIDYIPGSIRFVPKETGWLIAKLHFLDTINGLEVAGWTTNITAAAAGRINFNISGFMQGFDLVKGTQQITVFCPNQDLSWIEVSTNTQLVMGGLTSIDQISHVNLAMHVFNTDHLGSHVFGRPSLHCLIKDPSLTWAKTGLSGVNRGYTLTPATYEAYSILTFNPEVAPTTSLPL
jgi:hypothetical protein